MSRDRRLVAILLPVVACITLSGCDVPQTARCALTNIDAGLHASDAKTLGWAAECALAQSPQAIAPLVPALLKHVGDTRVYRVVQYGGGLIGFGEAGPRELSVGQIAMPAVESVGGDWRMAEHHDEAWGCEGNDAPPSTGTRFWVAISDQRGNCWTPEGRCHLKLRHAAEITATQSLREGGR